MSWEKVILSARNNPEYQEVIHQSYLDENLVNNVERFSSSEEFFETLQLIKTHSKPSNRNLIDIGSGNGISAISFSQLGYYVTAVEPNESSTVGTGAIKKLADHFNLDIQIINASGEQLPFPDHSFEIVYLRQTLHHVSDLICFLKECYRVLKPGGIIFTARDHVVYGKKDKEWFLTSHPFHRYYNGENAYKINEYTWAFKNAGFQIVQVMRHYDSVINFFPISKKDYIDYPQKMKIALREKLIQKIGIAGKLFISQFAYRCYKGFFPSWYNEKLIPGRLYSFIAIKP